MPRTMKTYSVFVLALCLAAPLYAHHVKGESGTITAYHVIP